MRKLLFIAIFFLLFIFAAWYVFGNNFKSNTPPIIPDVSPKQPTTKVIFPTANSTLVKGKTYTLRWTPEDSETTIQIFLIDKALESQGVSVSIADRIYDVNNSGSYSYTVPGNIPTGEYKFQIGNLNSEYFTITSQ